METKSELITRLIKEDKITIDEAMVLMMKEDTEKPQPIYPFGTGDWQPPHWPIITVTNKTVAPECAYVTGNTAMLTGNEVFSFTGN